MIYYCCNRIDGSSSAMYSNMAFSNRMILGRHRLLLGMLLALKCRHNLNISWTCTVNVTHKLTSIYLLISQYLEHNKSALYLHILSRIPPYVRVNPKWRIQGRIIHVMSVKARAATKIWNRESLEYHRLRLNMKLYFLYTEIFSKNLRLP